MGAASRRNSPPTVRWKPRMKSSLKSAASASESAMLAQRALAGIQAIDRVRSRGDHVDETLVARLAHQAASVSDRRPPSRSAERASRWPMAAAVAGALVVAIVAGGFVAVRTARSRHSVAGVILLDKRPLAGVRLLFHDTQASAPPAATLTAADGRFAVDSLPAGAYRVTVQAIGKDAPRLPAVYTNPETAVLGLTVKTDMDNVRMYAQRNYRMSVD